MQKFELTHTSTLIQPLCLFSTWTGDVTSRLLQSCSLKANISLCFELWAL